MQIVSLAKWAAAASLCKNKDGNKSYIEFVITVYTKEVKGEAIKSLQQNLLIFIFCVDEGFKIQHCIAVTMLFLAR